MTGHQRPPFAEIGRDLRRSLAAVQLGLEALMRRFGLEPVTEEQVDAYLAAEARAETDTARLAAQAPCCGGSGFADYAAVPCPAPGCPAVAAALAAGTGISATRRVISVDGSTGTERLYIGPDGLVLLTEARAARRAADEN